MTNEVVLGSVLSILLGDALEGAQVMVTARILAALRRKKPTRASSSSQAMNLDQILSRLGVDQRDVLSTKIWIGDNRGTDPYSPADAISSGPASGVEAGVFCAIPMMGVFLEIEAVKRSWPSTWP